ncbi:hypothetical protein O9993_07890 [Vibrio lentus]|nr:hypothetical protein [Vibrio lentus]
MYWVWLCSVSLATYQRYGHWLTYRWAYGDCRLGSDYLAIGYRGR